MPNDYKGPPIKGSFKGGKFKVPGGHKSGSVGSIKVGGKKLDEDPKKNNGRGPCYNNLQCQEWNQNNSGEWSCNQQTGSCECETVDEFDPCDPTSTPTPTPAPTPTVTPGSGAWCTGSFACDGKFYINGCSEGDLAAWTAGNDLNQVQGMNWGKTCAEISCVPEATPNCTPTPTPPPTYTPTPAPTPTPPPTYGIQ